MRTRKISGMILFGSVVAAVVIGCGGGGGGGGSATPSTVTAEGIQEVASRFVSNGMCADKSGTLTTISSSGNGSSVAVSSSGNSVSSSINNSSSAGNNSSINPFPAEARNSFTQTYPGALGGELEVAFEHLNGVNTRSFTFSNYENPINGEDVTFNGKGEKVEHGKPTDFGPVFSNTTAETKGPVAVTVSELGNSRAFSTKHYEYELVGYNRVYATNFGDPDKSSVKSASMTDIDEGRKYSFTNIKADRYAIGNGSMYKNMTGTYQDPEKGTFKLNPESDSITVNTTLLGSEIHIPTYVSGSVELKATDGTKGVLEVEGSSVKIYTKDDNGQKTLVSELDCPGLTEQ